MLKRSAVFSAFIILLFSSSLGKERSMLTLEESLNIALERSHDIKLMEQNLIRDQERVKAERAALKSNAHMHLYTPSFNTAYEEVYDSEEDIFRYEYTQKNKVMSKVVVNQPIPTNGNFSFNYDFFHETQLGDIKNYSNNFYLKFEQPIFTPNVLNMRIRRAELSLKETELDYTSRKVQIEYRITRSYYNLFRYFAQLEINNKRLELLEKSYDIAETLNSRGIIDEMELLQIEVELADSRDEILETEGRLTRSKDSFKQTIGLPKSEDIVIEPVLEYKPIQLADEIKEKTIELGMQNSTRIKDGEIRKEFRTLDVIDADRLNEFKGSIVTTVGLDKKDSVFTETLKKPDQTRSVSLNFYLPLWDWGRNKAQVRSAQASLKYAETSLSENRRTVKRWLEDELRDLEDANIRLEILSKSKKLADKSYALGIEKFKNGQINSQSLILVIEQLINSNKSFLSAYIDFQYAKAGLKRLINGAPAY
ncbi:TolC family protein [candidate division KSB1 bacterium]